MQVTLKTTKLVKKENTKTVYNVESIETKQIDWEQYKNIIDPKTSQFMRRLGGSESITKGYTCRGYNVVKVVSTSPDKENRTIRQFEFN
jgi:hypothetical protein